MATVKGQFQYTRPDAVEVVWNFYPSGSTFARPRALALFIWGLPLEGPIEFWLLLRQPLGGGQYEEATIKYTGSREGALQFLCYWLNHSLVQTLQLQGMVYGQASDTWYANDNVVIPEGANVALPAQASWPSPGTPVLGQAQVLNTDGTVTVHTLHAEDGTSFIHLSDLINWVDDFGATIQVRLALRIRMGDPTDIVYFAWTVWTAGETVLLTAEALSLQYLLLAINRASWLQLGSWLVQQAKGPFPGGSKWYNDWFWYAKSVNCPPSLKPEGYGLLWQDTRPDNFTFQGYVRQTTPGDGCHPAQYRAEAQQTPLPVGTSWLSTRFPAPGGGASLTFQNYCMGAPPFTDTATDAWEYGIDAYEAWIRLNALAQTRRGGPYRQFVRTLLKAPMVGVRAEILLPPSLTTQTPDDYVAFYVGMDRIAGIEAQPVIEASVSHKPRLDGTQDRWAWFVNNAGVGYRGPSTPRFSARLRMELGNVFGGFTAVNFYVDDILVWSGAAKLGGRTDAYPKYVTGVSQNQGEAFVLRFDPDATWSQANYQILLPGGLRVWAEWADPATETTPAVACTQRLKYSYLIEFVQRRDYFL